MDKKEAWKKFKETGKIEYYLKYKGKEVELNDYKSDGFYCQ